jgi:hypothetical protein
MSPYEVDIDMDLVGDGSEEGGERNISREDDSEVQSLTGEYAKSKSSV